MSEPKIATASSEPKRRPGAWRVRDPVGASASDLAPGESAMGSTTVVFCSEDDILVMPAKEQGQQPESWLNRPLSAGFAR